MRVLLPPTQILRCAQDDKEAAMGPNVILSEAKDLGGGIRSVR